MFIEGLHEKQIFSHDFPFRLVENTQDTFIYPLHWHRAVEFVYAVENEFIIHVNNREYRLDEKDILIVSCGDIHSIDTHHNKGKRVFIQFDTSLLLNTLTKVDAVQSVFSNTQLISPKVQPQLHNV